jgi:type IV secretion system protein VirD4
MLPQELKELPQHQQIVLCANTKPILCDKARYYEDERFLDRLSSVSPSLARHTHSPLGRTLRALGLRASFMRPSEQQLKHAAFVLRELSAPVPKITVTTITEPNAVQSQEARGEPQNLQSARPLLPGEAINLAALAFDINTLPAFDDAENPSPESVSRLVDQFFAHLEWTGSEEDSGSATSPTNDSVAGVTSEPLCSQTGGVIAETRGLANRSRTHGQLTSGRGMQLDLSLLDEPPITPTTRN